MKLTTEAEFTHYTVIVFDVNSRPKFNFDEKMKIEENLVK